jgi:DNA invertase Pin-like site-specific DNA recombinase
VDVGWSGTKAKRPELDRLMGLIRQGQIDVLLLFKFDRFARSLTHLVSTLAELRERGVEFASYSEQIDTSTSTGKLMFGVLAAFGEFERDIISERVKAGLAAARKRGKTLGREKLDEKTAIQARKLREEGQSYRQIAKALRISHGIVPALLARSEVHS